MKNTLLAAVVVVLSSIVGFAQESTQPPAPPSPPVTVTSPVPEVSADGFGLHGGINLAVLAADYQRGHFYGFASVSLGTPLVTDGRYIPMSVGAGGTWTLVNRGSSRWQFDLFGVATPVLSRLSSFSVIEPSVGVGLGVGFRYMHKSGFTLGLKAPIVGLSTRGGSLSGAYGEFLLSNIAAMPMVSFGYHF